MRNPPRNNPHTNPQPEGTLPSGFSFALFSGPPGYSPPPPVPHGFAGHTPPTSSPDTKACIPAAGLPSCHSVFPHHPFLLRSCFRTHLHLVPHPLHSSPSHPSDAHCPPVSPMWAGASAAGLSALLIHLFFPGASACTALSPFSASSSGTPCLSSILSRHRAHLRTPIAGSVRTLRQPIPGRAKKQRMS